MKNKILYKYIHIIILFLSLSITLGFSANNIPRQSKVFGPPGRIRINPYLFNGFSRKKLCRSRATTPYGYSILHNPYIGIIDTFKIIALRVEFKIDSSEITTGNGLFGIYRTIKGTSEDLHEFNYYPKNGGAAYIYDDLRHDSIYFANQLEFVKNYFWMVSNKRLFIDYCIYPKGKNEEDAYKVPEQMTKYSPGAKKKKESWDDYYYRRTVGLMKFVCDAIQAADSDTDSPFKNLEMDPDGIIYEKDPNNPIFKRKVAILIFHAGASYLTDGGWDGYFGADTPSDMIDAFISNEFFEYFANTDSIPGIEKDSLGRAGIRVNNTIGKRFILDELMMASETSNQDSLNWGIHGILVNQVARQLGIPDLFSTMSGISGIGAFCIMDFAGYSTGRGFIPPWPSAWVRAYMGWDSPKVIEPGKSKIAANLTAVSNAKAGDTTILLVPINNHEYWLIENRQRNLTGDPTLFNYDTLEDVDPKIDGSIVIDPYDHVNLNANVLSTFDESNVIDSVKNFDVSIPASGILIWHVDEYIIRDHLEQNVINADSSYRGISLEEADGVVDLGVMFMDMFYQAAFDYGGAADVFPHYTSENNSPVNIMGPFTRPSTQSNDGGHTYLKIIIKAKNSNTFKEISIIEGKLVYNFVDSIFQITVGKDTTFVSSFPNWPKRIVPAKFYEPVLCNVYSNGDSLELAVIDTEGRVYVWSAEGDTNLFSPVKEALPTILYSNDTIYNDSISYLARIPQPASIPTCIDTSLYIPSKDGNIYILRNLDTLSATWDTLKLGSPASSYVCNYSGTKWAVGCANGTIVYGNDASGSRVTITTFSQAPIQALAVINNSEDTLAAVDSNGLLMVCSKSGVIDSISLGTVQIVEIFPPFTLVTADFDQDDIDDIVVCDRKQGLWLFNYDGTTRDLYFDNEWIGWPNDWAGSHRLDASRAAIPDNESAPSIADLDNDNMLDIIVGGTNGIYAYNHRGVLLVEWPALLDTRFWYQRGSITSSPVIAFEPNRTDPLVIFSAPTGENITFAVAHIDSSNASTGTIYFTKKDGISDSVSGLSASLIDSLLVIGDSLVLPYILPGGYVDAFNMHGKRPDTITTLSNVGKEIQSNWPFTVGGSITTSPLLCDMDNNKKTDIIAVSDGGWVYRWEVSDKILPSYSDSIWPWPQVGSNGSRIFTYAGPITDVNFGMKPNIEHFYNYPNPIKGFDKTSFKYRLTRPAQNVRLDIFTYTGYHIVSDRNLPAGFGWNEHIISIKKFGSAVYRCRLEANFNGKKKVKYWKMAVIK